jgi:hypothetical protein
MISFDNEGTANYGLQPEYILMMINGRRGPPSEYYKVANEKASSLKAR